MKKLLIGLAIGAYVTRVGDNFRFMKKYPELERSKEMRAALDKAKAAFSNK